MRILAALATIAAATVAAAVAQSADVDRAYDLVGRWTCASAAGSSATLTFTRQGDGSIRMRNIFIPPHAAQGEFDETYRLISPARYWLWTATLQGNPDFKEAATAGPWTATSWFFDGTMTHRPHPHDTDTHRIRIVYAWLDNASFQREFEIYEGDVWKSTSSAVCRRKS